ncbi:hypothetical protein J6590_073556 [Homalodisca vitripennis]|nr:hypothetical protein J6590_073556 [Homalodisca vitripennis]
MSVKSINKINLRGVLQSWKRSTCSRPLKYRTDCNRSRVNGRCVGDPISPGDWSE